jgi:integrase
MSTRALTRRPEADLLPTPELAKLAAGLVEEADAENTTRVYASQWAQFEAWCRLRGVRALPADVNAVAGYLTERSAGKVKAKLSTLEVALAAIARKHLDHDLPPPQASSRLLKRLWKGIRRRLGAARSKAAAMSPEQLRRLLKACDGPGLQCARDSALLVLGWSAALRRGELVALEVSDVEFQEDGLRITIRKSKGDQEGKGAVVGVVRGSDPRTCPVRTLRAWLDASGIEEGLIFRSLRNGQLTKKAREGHGLRGEDVSLAIKRLADDAGYSAKEIEALSGHSLRRGLGTTAAKRGSDLIRIQKHMRHKRVDQTAEYVDEAELLDEDNVTTGIGL